MNDDKCQGVDVAECDEGGCCDKHLARAMAEHARLAGAVRAERYTRKDIEDAYSDPSDAHKRISLLRDLGD
jgi:hypothetical protein